MRVYAAADDLNEAPWHADLEPTEAFSLLARATPLLEELTKTAVYATDTDGYPTNARIAAAFKHAACAQALWFSETGDTSGTSARFNSLSLGSFSVSGGGTGAATNTSADQSRYSPETIQILSNAGLTGRSPVL